MRGRVLSSESAVAKDWVTRSPLLGVCFAMAVVEFAFIFARI